MGRQQRIWAVVPAAGIGRRLGAQVPKQYLELRGRMVIEYALRPLLEHPAISEVWVALRDPDPHWGQCAYASHPTVVTVEGGAERSASVSNALDGLAARAHGLDWVLVHDAARPCLARVDLDRLIEQVRDHPVGGLLAGPVSDTIKRRDTGGNVKETLDRADLWRAFTPQMFRLGQLRSALQAAREAEQDVTDESQAVERLGLRPMLVAASAPNIKITRYQDLALAVGCLDDPGNDR